MTTTTTMPAALGQAGFSAAAVEGVSEFVGDAAWMRERRMSAWASFEQIPMPGRRDEHWRFTNLRRLQIDTRMPFTGAEAEEPALERAAAAVTAVADPAARIVAANGSTVASATVRGELPDGVIVAELSAAARDHADLVQRHWGSAVPVTGSVDDKFVALNEALWSTGVFVYVPRNTKVELPIEYVVSHSVDGATTMPRVLIVLEENAEATFIEELVSAGDDLAGLSNAVTELVVGAGARLSYTTVQDYAVPVAHFATHRVVAARDAQVEWNAVGLGASMGKVRMEARLAGPGSHVKLTGVYLLNGSQQLDYDTRQVHEAPNATSDLSFKGVLADEAASVWRGMIVVDRGAQGTDSYQENRNLLLSRTAHADSIPGLQIEANEVRCTHGATISKVDPEQLFYLQARGISRHEAAMTIVRGFLEPALDRMSSDEVRMAIRSALWEQMDLPVQELLADA